MNRQERPSYLPNNQDTKVRADLENQFYDKYGVSSLEKDYRRKLMMMIGEVSDKFLNNQTNYDSDKTYWEIVSDIAEDVFQRASVIGCVREDEKHDKGFEYYILKTGPLLRASSVG